MIDYTEETLDRMRQVESLNYFTHFDPDAVKEQAITAHKAYQNGTNKALEGLLIGVKDNIAEKGAVLTGGYKKVHAECKQDSTIWSFFRSFGAIRAARTNMHRLAFGTSGQNSCYGDMGNPYDFSRSVGGSSGGSGGVVGSGALSMALGTDTGGSIRIPAAWCNSVGYRPSVNYWPSDYGLKCSNFRDTVGPIATCMDDIIFVSEILNKERITDVIEREYLS